MGPQNELAALGRIVFGCHGIELVCRAAIRGIDAGWETALVAVVPMTMAGKLKQLRARAVTELADGYPSSRLYWDGSREWNT